MDNYSINLAELIESPEVIQLSLMNFSADYETGHHLDEHSACYHSSTLELVSPGTQLFLVLLYSVTALLSLLGNLTVIAVQLVGHESAASVRRHLISLAIADIISGVLCKCANSFVHVCTALVTLTAGQVCPSPSPASPSASGSSLRFSVR